MFAGVPCVTGFGWRTGQPTRSTGDPRGIYADHRRGVQEVVVAGADGANGTPRTSPGGTSHRAAPLAGSEKRLVALAALGPVVAAAVVLVPIAAAVGAGVADVVVGAVVYGGLLGLAAAFVTFDRLQSRQCPRCTERHGGATVCAACGYDLGRQPRFVCDERHLVALEPGLCPCGRRLRELPTARGIHREVVFVVKLGVWLLALLIGIGLVLRLLEGAG